MTSFRLVFLLLLAAGQLHSAPGTLDPAKFTVPIRVACVGDDLTEGVGTTPGFAYPAQLQELLGNRWLVGNFGVRGRTLLRSGDYPYWRPEPALQQAQDFQPDVVILMLGTNDSKPHNWLGGEWFDRDFGDLADVFLRLPKKPVVYICRPAPVPTPGNGGINEAVIQDEILLINRLAAAMNLEVIDMHAALAGKPHLLPDRVHPDNEGALLMAKTAYTALTGLAPVEPLRVNSLFFEHAVLQRDTALPVWGSGPEGEEVTVEFAGQKASALVRDGQWQVTLPPLAASAMPATLTVCAASKRIIIPDILVGDVWVAGGQSNMERQLGPRPPQQDIIGWRRAAEAADLPLIREFYVPPHYSAPVRSDVHGSWRVATPTNVVNFSAVAFFFARDLQPAVRVPVGIIHSSWGGTIAEAWASPEGLKDFPDFQAKIEAIQTGTPPAERNVPTVLYNAMIAPLTRFRVKGFLWYQGEANNARPTQYRTLLPALIADWRQQWHASLPFLIVQIATHKSITPELREAQLLTVQSTPNTALIVTTDVGDANDIHPANKQPVGVRLALAARALAYGEKIEYSGPCLRRHSVIEHGIELTFDHVGQGLVAKNGPLKGFTIAGADNKFVPAKAEIRGEKIIVSSPDIAFPAAARYDWAKVPDGNLFNRDGLPASPFRTNPD